ncbi:MAG: protease modulator HflC [bacterium]|nr:protease modulator HflC [bacterium]
MGKKAYLFGLAVILLLLVNDIFFVVDETKTAVVTQFGRPVKVITEAGLNWKLPVPIHSALFFEKRLIVYEPRPSEFLTKDKKNVIVDTFVCWRIKDPQRFLETVNDKERAEIRLADIIASEVGVALGKEDLSSLFSIEPGQKKGISEASDRVTERCQAVAEKDYGIHLVSVRIRRLNFPEQNKQSVFGRMIAERDRMARKYRAEGKEEAIKIKAETDKEKRRILSEAYQEAERVKGEGDREAIKIYAGAFNQDPQFYKLVRTLESYKKFLDKKTTVILSSESELLELLNKGTGK